MREHTSKEQSHLYIPALSDHMSSIPLNKRQKVAEQDIPNDGSDETDQIPKTSPSSSSTSGILSKSRTPRKLVIGFTEDHYANSQPVNSSSSLQAPSLQPPNTSSRGRDARTYSQSPPRSPGRSPARKLELIQISPVKKSRIELQKVYDSQNNQNKSGRLCINKLVLHDFKSYAGRQVVGPFHSSFSAVVGPNGSGKSNVIDSMLFVFGFRANKMRQDRLSDLIHKSEEFPNLPSCSVEVHFQYVIDEQDGGARVNEEKVGLVITRKAFKNNSSKYYINGRESNYTEVTKLLKTEGVDLDHKRFLILQGEVENIAQMRPKAEKEGEDGLLEYLEDIIGTANYKPLIEQNMLEIEALNEICMEKENRFQIVDKEKNSLEAGKEEALEFLEKEKNLTLLRSQLVQYQLLQNNTKLSSTLEKATTLNELLSKENQKHSVIISEMDKLKEEEKEIVDKLRSYALEEKELLTRKRNIDGDKVSMEEKAKNLNQKKNNAEHLLTSTENSLTESKAKLVELEQLQLEYDDELEGLHEQLKTERSKLEQIKLSLKGKTVGISAELAQHEKNLEPWNEKLQEKKAQIQLAESEISLLRESQTKLQKEIESLKQEITARNEERSIKQKNVEKLREEKEVIAKDISIGESECSSANSRLKDMQDTLNAHRQRAMDARTAVSTAENKSKVLTVLSRLQKSGRINGFYGRLGDLGVIDNKYDIAISTACPRLEDIVVDSVECGQQCIEYLRKNKLGYARFILLDKLRKFNTSPIRTPEDVARLFDLIQPREEKFVPAFYSVLRDTLVSRDLAQANRVAYGKKRFRVVTLDGKLIDISGTMSGGGNHVVRGLMKVAQNKNENFEIYSPEDVAQLEHALAEREKNFQIASETYREMEEQLKILKGREPEIELKISQLLVEIDFSNNELNMKVSQLAEREESYERAIVDVQEYSKAENHLKALKEDQKSLENQTKSKKREIDLLKKEIMKIGGSDLQLQNSKVSSVVQRMDTITAKQKKEKSGIKKTENEQKKFTKILKEAQDDLDSFTHEIEGLAEKIKDTQLSLNDTEESISMIQGCKNELNDKSEALKKRLLEMEENASEFKSLKVEINNKLEKLNALVNHIKKEIQRSEAEMRNLKLRDVTRTLQQLDDGELAEQSISSEGEKDCETGEMKDCGSFQEDQDISEEEPMDIDGNPKELESGLPILSEEELKQLDTNALEEQIAQLEEYVNSASVNIDVLEEYARRLAEHKRRKLDLNQAVEKRDTTRDQLDQLKKKRFEEFMQGFGIISMTLKEMYQMITMGGNAELELVDSLDPFSEGVTFSVMPPKKSWRNITNLSGGEKTLSSLALVFALHKYKPTPLYVMDEIDAALDFRNVSIVANYIKERTKNAQFIVISLRNNMFELAQQLVGIYKRDNMTKSATLRNRDILNRE